jgi:non-ribosomal peptide synthetase-like protein
MMMTRFCARVRKRPDLPNVTIRDVYCNPTIKALTAAFTSTAPADRLAGGSPEPAGSRSTALVADPELAQEPVRCINQPSAELAVVPPTPVTRAGSVAVRPAPVGMLGYLLCGALQLLFLFGYPMLIGTGLIVGYEWVLVAASPADIYLRSVIVGVAGFLGLSLLPIVVKWLLIGRWKPQEFPIWSLRYFRFWLVKTLIRTNPLVRFAGSPLYVLYLRLLGAKIGTGATILSPTVPVCTDMLTIGVGALIRKTSTFSGYRAHDGLIQTGPVHIGRDAIVGEATVLDIGSSVGEGAQLGHASSLHAGQAVPYGQRWHGSPAEPTSLTYRRVRGAGCSGLRKAAYSVVQLLLLLGVVLPLGISSLILLVSLVPQLAALLGEGPPAALTWTFYRDALVLSTALFIGALLFGLSVMIIVPRLLRVLVRPNKIYRLYGISYWAHQTIGRLTNSKFFLQVFGDSSFVVSYLQALGYDLGRVEQTGSNFGTAVAHDNPFLSAVGRGSVVADGLTFLNADYSNTSFRVARVAIGGNNFLGNNIFYPVQGRTGDDCLVATKAMVPMDGPVREGVGLLGSPSFEIPRTTERDSRLALSPDQRRRGLAGKNRHNLVSITLLLLTRWILTSLLTVVALTSLDLYSELGAAVFALNYAVGMPLTFVYFILLDRMVRGLAALQPQGCSIYDRRFWRHERFWKVCAYTYVQAVNGTPFKGLVWRLLGVRVGRRLFDDGCIITERVFVTIGHRCTLNAGTVIQCHSQENNAFKSDRVELGSDVTIGVNGFVHYGVRLGGGAVLEADSFLMKGEQVPPRTRWAGYPAMEVD